MGYKISCFSQIVLDPRSLVLCYICTRDLEIYMYMYVCVHV